MASSSHNYFVNTFTPVYQNENDLYSERFWFEKTKECWEALGENDKYLAASTVKTLAQWTDERLEEQLNGIEPLSAVTRPDRDLAKITKDIDCTLAMGRQLALYHRRRQDRPGYSSGFGVCRSREGTVDWSMKYLELVSTAPQESPDIVSDESQPKIFSEKFWFEKTEEGWRTLNETQKFDLKFEILNLSQLTDKRLQERLGGKPPMSAVINSYLPLKDQTFDTIQAATNGRHLAFIKRRDKGEGMDSWGFGQEDTKNWDIKYRSLVGWNWPNGFNPWLEELNPQPNN